MNKPSFIYLTILYLVFASCDNSASESKSSENREDVMNAGVTIEDLTVKKIQLYNTVIFGDGCKVECDSFHLTFIKSNKVEVNYTHVYNKFGRNIYVKNSEKGVYDYKIVPSDAIEVDNDLVHPIDSIMIISNANYGYDKGYNLLEKRFAIMKVRDKSGYVEELQIYKWLDPIHYPGRNQEYVYQSGVPVKAFE